MSDELISVSDVVKGSEWIKSNYGDLIKKRLEGTLFDLNLVCAIACQESHYFWFDLIDKYSADYILGRCVLDASGDYPGTMRNAFPKNTNDFLNEYGSDLTNTLIAEANQTRKIRGFSDQQWVYKGYGIFQYDLQYIKMGGEDFFTQKQWYSIDMCVEKLVSELNEKSKYSNSISEIVKMYNGSGPKAVIYSQRVMTYYSYL